MPVQVLRTTADPNYFAIYPDEAAIRGLSPKLSVLESLHPFGVVASAPGNPTNIVSRYFAPSYGIPEDPVTGSIHCALMPYWGSRLGRDELSAHQASARGGSMRCRLAGDGVYLTGSALEYLRGTISVDQLSRRSHTPRVKPALDRHPCLMGRRSRRQVSAVPPRQPALGPDSRSRNQHIAASAPGPSC